MELGGGRSESWNEVKMGKARRKRKKVGQKGRSSISEETDNEQVGGDEEYEEEHKVIIRLEQEGASFGEWNLVLLTKGVNSLVGEIKSAKVLCSGALLMFYRNSTQLGKAIRLNKIEGKRVKATIARGGGSHWRSDFWDSP